MQRPDIQSISAKWIAELRLQDRIVTVRYVPNLCDAFGNPVYGLMTIQNLDEGRFLIEVQDPLTWPAGGSRELSEASIEEGIVHELVHVRWIDLTAHNPDPAALVQEERATWATARALIRANTSQRAGIVRAMMAKQAATRRQTKGRSMAMDPATAKMLLDALDSDDIAAVKAAIRKIAEDGLTGGQDGPPSVQDPMAPPMGADAGNDPAKDKPPMNMGDKPELYARAMRAELTDIRAMKADIVKLHGEARTAVEMLRPNAKAEIVRSMRADGIALTPHAEKLITEAPTLEAAKERAESMRSMAPEGTKRKSALPPTGDAAGLTRSQLATYTRMSGAGNPGAETYRAECIKANQAAKGGA